MDNADDRLRVEVVYADPDRQELVELKLEQGATVADAICAGLSKRLADIPLDALQAGIWGNPVERSKPLADGDRVELYRPLERDPREARRELAAAGRSMGGGESG